MAFEGELEVPENVLLAAEALAVSWQAEVFLDFLLKRHQAVVYRPSRLEDQQDLPAFLQVQVGGLPGNVPNIVNGLQ